jgi:single-strand DNA-binding protein
MTSTEPDPERLDDQANVVRLRGRISTPPELRELPSGTSIVTFRLSVARSPTAMTKGSKQSTDWIDCVAWGARARRACSRWRAGDTAEVQGALRRRFYRSAAGASTRLEVEMLGGRLVARAPSGARRRGQQTARAAEEA